MTLLPPRYDELSLFRTAILSYLYMQYALSPLYTLPSDYLTREENCRYVQVDNSFVWTCDNACDLSVVDELPKFDYIVVGSGPAGSAIAYRLATLQPNRTTLLIETGANPNVDTIVPSSFIFNLNTTSSHNFFAELSPKYGNAFKNGVNCYAGKGVGGGTAINAMIWNCGCDENYNAWATAANDPSWNYANFLQYIKKPQGLQDPSGSLLSGSCGAYQGTTGPVVLNNRASTEDYMSQIIANVAAFFGFPLKPNLNCGPPFTGFANTPMSINAGQRQSAGRSYLRPLSEFSNFYFMRNSTVSKVDTSKKNGEWVATGVTVHTNIEKCSRIKIKAKREVIISAGALNSPGILTRSGIAREDDLDACNIKQVSDVPTGKTLVDHVQAVQFFTMPGLNLSPEAGAALIQSLVSQYLFNNTGPYSSVQGLHITGNINTVNSSANCPNIKLTSTPFAQNLPDLDIILKNKLGYKNEYADQILAKNQNENVIYTSVVLVSPKSKGTIKLGHCKDPNVAPIINANYFDDPRDLDAVVQGMLFMCQFYSVVEQSLGIKPFKVNIPECNSLTQCTDAYFRCYVKYFSYNEWHPSGTCKMGTSSANGVVNNRLKVFGVDKLRVADASIMPEIPNGNTQCPVYAIGEKAADMIIADNP